MDTQYDDEVFLTTRQVMEILNCSRQYVSKLRNKGVLSSYRRGNEYLLTAKEVEALISRKKTIIKLTKYNLLEGSNIGTQYNEEVFLTTRQVMDILNCSRQYVSKLRNKGVLISYRRGNEYLLSAKEVEALISRKKTIIKLTSARNP